MYPELKIKVDKDALLITLRANLERHDQIVKEARQAYCKKAREQLENKIDELAKGKCSSLAFRLLPPESHADDYKRAIKMLEMSSDDEIVLDAETFQCFVEDNWNWMRVWLSSNSSSSSIASSYSSAKYHEGEQQKGTQ